jgi:hypothetical protein
VRTDRSFRDYREMLGSGLGYIPVSSLSIYPNYSIILDHENSKYGWQMTIPLQLKKSDSVTDSEKVGFVGFHIGCFTRRLIAKTVSTCMDGVGNIMQSHRL